MKKTNIKPSYLQIVYLIIYLILFAFIIYTPTLINGPVYLSKKLIIEEETFEGTLIAILFLLSIWIFTLYRHEVYKHKELINKISNDKKKIEEKLSDADHYIGLINVQIQEINSIFNNISKYPETKNDFKKTFRLFGDRILGIVCTNWVLFRIIDNNNQRTICEHFATRQGFEDGYPHVSNKMVIEKQPILPFTYVISSPKNLNILVFCVMPVDKISNDQQLFIQAIINEITKLFVILNSIYYKNESRLLFEERPDRS